MLSYFNWIGIEMTDEHSLIRELCENSSPIETEWYDYYDMINIRRGHVIHGVTKKVKESS